MAGDDLRQLERDVEASRAKLTGDIAALRSPNAFSEFTQNLKQTAMETRDNFIDDARTRTRSAIEDVVETVREKAVANPTATLVIGAGIAWHFIRHPPITAALIGGGLYSLLRTEAPARPNGHGEPLARARQNLKAQADEFAATAGELGRSAADTAKDKMSELTEAATQRAGELRETAAEKVADLSETARDRLDELREGVKETVASAPLIGSRGNRAHSDGRDVDPHAYYGLPGEQPVYASADELERRDSVASTDKLLLGAAGIAVAAAFAAIYQRRRSEFPD